MHATMAQFSMAKKIAQQFGGVIGITGYRFAEIFCASFFFKGIPYLIRDT
jgi:hypothetical protein